MLSIGALSRITGVRVPTIRYYEQIGLLPAPERTEGNQRRYTRADADRLAFIRHARELGFPLGAIGELARLGAEPGRPCVEASRIARAQLDDVRDRIARLTRLEAELARLATGCDDAAVESCTVLRALSAPAGTGRAPAGLVAESR